MGGMANETAKAARIKAEKTREAKTPTHMEAETAMQGREAREEKIREEKIRAKRAEKKKEERTRGMANETAKAARIKAEKTREAKTPTHMEAETAMQGREAREEKIR